jgi:hypothetical protein
MLQHFLSGSADDGEDEVLRMRIERWRPLVLASIRAARVRPSVAPVLCLYWMGIDQYRYSLRTARMAMVLCTVPAITTPGCPFR